MRKIALVFLFIFTGGASSYIFSENALRNDSLSNTTIIREDAGQEDIDPVPEYVCGQGLCLAGFFLREVQEMAFWSEMTYLKDFDPATGLAEMKKLDVLDHFQKEGYRLVFFEDGEEHTGLVVIKPDGHIVITYHGTQSIQNVGTDIDTLLVTSSWFEGRSHSGFLSSFERTWDNIYQILLDCARWQNKAVHELSISVTGHSLGGALATLAGFRLASVGRVNDIRVTTFGSPRVFDFIAAEKYQCLLGEKTLRVAEYGSDPITALPPAALGFQHVGHLLRIDKPSSAAPHSLDGYRQSLDLLKPENYCSDNSPSWLYCKYSPLAFLREANYFLQENVVYPLQCGLASSFLPDKDSLIEYRSSITPLSPR